MAHKHAGWTYHDEPCELCDDDGSPTLAEQWGDAIVTFLAFAIAIVAVAGLFLVAR